MGALVFLVKGPAFDAIAANYQRAVTVDDDPALAPGTSVVVTCEQRFCHRVISCVTRKIDGLPETVALVSLRPLTGAERAARMVGENPA